MTKPQKILVYRHAGVTRLTHWINVLALTLLLMSGLNIFGAHPALYWGQKSTFAHPWLLITAVEVRGTGADLGPCRAAALPASTGPVSRGAAGGPARAGPTAAARGAPGRSARRPR